MFLNELKFRWLLTNFSDEPSETPAFQSSDKIVNGSSSRPATRNRKSGKWASWLDPSTWTSSSDDEHEPEDHSKPAPETFNSSFASPPTSIVLPSFTSPPPRSPSQKVCGKCAQSMSGQFVRALGDIYHLGCFTCKVSFTRQPLPASTYLMLRTAAQSWLPNSSLCKTDQSSFHFVKRITFDVLIFCVPVVDLPVAAPTSLLWSRNITQTASNVKPTGVIVYLELQTTIMSMRNMFIAVSTTRSTTR